MKGGKTQQRNKESVTEIVKYNIAIGKGLKKSLRIMGLLWEN
jgi:hypothetical protein